MLKNIDVAEALSEGHIGDYYTHEAEISNIKYDPVGRTLSFRLFYDGWIKERHEAENMCFTNLDVVFDGVVNLNIVRQKADTTGEEVKYVDVPVQPLESIEETLLGIYREDTNVVEILVDNDWSDITVIKFVADKVSVTEK